MKYQYLYLIFSQPHYNIFICTEPSKKDTFLVNKNSFIQVWSKESRLALTGPFIFLPCTISIERRVTYLTANIVCVCLTWKIHLLTSYLSWQACNPLSGAHVNQPLYLHWGLNSPTWKLYRITFVGSYFTPSVKRKYLF